jgi:hypothetical protein
MLFVAMIGLIAPHWSELLTVFVPPKGGGSEALVRNLARWGTRAAMICAAFVFTYWIANFNNREPTPIDGAWDVVRIEPQNLAAQAPKTIFFEYNRAHMAVLKDSHGSYRTHHFEVDASAHRIQMWETWRRKGDRIFDGISALADGELMLQGIWQDAGPLTLSLSRRSYGR